jgi:hypothetical protein
VRFFFVVFVTAVTKMTGIGEKSFFGALSTIEFSLLLQAAPSMNKP